MKVSRHIVTHKITENEFLTINTVTGAVDIVDSNVHCFLKGLSTSDDAKVDPLVLDRLASRGYLVEDREMETLALNKLISILSRRHKRLGITICPTYSCNFRCTYCFEGNTTNSSDLRLTESDIPVIFSAIDKLLRKFNDREASIDLFGGEPFLPNAKGFIASALKESELRGLAVKIVTNGFNVRLFEQALKEYKSTIQVVQITIDGPADIHNSRRKLAGGQPTFDTICSSVDFILSIGLKIALRINIDNQNIPSLPELVEIFKAKGWLDHDNFRFSFAPVQDHSFSGQYEHFLAEDVLIDRVLKLIESHPEIESGFGINMFKSIAYIKSVIAGDKMIAPMANHCEANYLENLAFGADGFIYACTECINNPALAIGRFIPDLSFNNENLEIWNNRSIQRIPKCMDCNIAFFCGGGCAYSALSVNGNIDDPVCNNAHKTIDTYLDFLGKQLSSKSKQPQTVSR